MAPPPHPGRAIAPTPPARAGRPAGSNADLAALARPGAGRSDVALVVGVELMRNVSAKEAAQHLGSAAWAGREAQDADFPWPALFAEIADEVDTRYGLSHEHLARIAEINHTNALRNPLAQARSWSFPDGCFGADDTLNPVVEGQLRKYDCGRITDGAAAVILASDRYGRSGPTISGW